MKPFRAHIWFLLVACALGVPMLADAQISDSVRLEGRVVEEGTGNPIGFVQLTVLDHELRLLRRVEAGRDGRFTVDVPWKEDGVYILAERIGYRENQTPFLWFDDHSYFQVEIRLDADAMLLAPLEVVARARRASPVLEDFRARTESGLGHYITREDIVAANPGRVTDLLATVPGVQLRSSGAGLRRVVQMSRAQSPISCPTQIYIDGMRLNTDTGPREAQIVAIDEYVSPGSIEGIEIYRGLSTVPASFLNEYADCGVVVIWTRRGP